MEQVNQRMRWNCPVYLVQVLQGQGDFGGDGLEGSPGWCRGREVFLLPTSYYQLPVVTHRPQRVVFAVAAHIPPENILGGDVHIEQLVLEGQPASVGR
jgi:hypothetical protein